MGPLTGALVACASIMGVEEPTLDPALGGSAETGAPTPTDEPGFDAGAPVKVEPGCVGAACACNVDGDCKDPGHAKCVDHKCSECTTTPVDSCRLGGFCLAGVDGGLNECSPGCKSNADCPGGAAALCNLQRHTCVECIQGQADAGCANVNQECSPGGTCADKCTNDGGTCNDTTKTCCRGLCIDRNTDIANCGTCGNACQAPNNACCAGACKNTLGDPAHCGRCGSACSTVQNTPTCGAGNCRFGCNDGFNHCATGNTGCETSTSANLTQCGSCTNNCSNNVKNANGTACASSACTYATCKPNFIDKNATVTDGCEAPCGTRNIDCCSNNTCNTPTLLCVNNVCRDCGGTDQPCCATTPCNNANLVCASGTCRACGDNNQLCCTNSTCNNGFECKSDGRCKPVPPPPDP